MNKPEIQKQISENHTAFVQTLKQISDEAFLFTKDGKWSAGEQLDHIIKSVSPVIMVFSLPKFIPRLLYGHPNRASRSYEQVVADYEQLLKNGAKATGKYIPREVPIKFRQRRMEKLEKATALLAKNINAYSEEQLDQYQVPHPLLGKMTIRELLYFTIYHVQIHDRSVKALTEGL
jgi:hypothetical protein